MELDAKIERGLRHRWDELHNKKTSLLAYAEQYALWTLPYVFPRENQSENVQLPIAQDSIGAQGANHLSNKIVSTLFPAKSLFFRLHIDQEMKDMIAKALNADGAADAEESKKNLETALLQAEEQLLAAEKRAEDYLDMVQYRPQAINAVKLLIITGNAMVFHPEDDLPVQVYNFRNYHVVRDCSGTPIDMMTRETRAFETFRPEIQEQLKQDAAFKNSRLNQGASRKDYKHDTEVTIYTRILLEDDGKYHVTQYADDVRLDTDATYTADKLRWIPLVWNLIQGEDYGRGLVADFSGAFHAVNVLSSSLLNLAAVMGDVKFFVDPQSLIDVKEVETSPPGSYHVGRAEHIGTAQMQKLQEAQFIQAMIERYERQIAQGFMLTQQLTRQAERVTAEEIRRDVDELETSNSGIYSRLAATWQLQTAVIALHDTGFTEIGDGIEPRVITGMDSLSRAGEAYNMRLFLSDLGLLNAVPEDVRAGIKKPQFIKQISQYHQVPYESFVMTQAEMQAQAEAEFRQQQALQAQQQAGNVQAEAAKAAVQE